MVTRTGEHGGGEHRWVRLVADPQSVPAARRFARDTVTEWALPDLAEDAALCVSELATNAALHSGSDYLELALVNDAGAVRIVVDDAAAASTETLIRAGADLGGEPAVEDGIDSVASTGRGLLVVAALADQWGIEPIPTGKRIWVRLAHGEDHRPSPPQTHAGGPGVEQPRMPAGWHMLCLTGFPVALSQAHSQRIDDLLRELQLLDTGEEESPGELAEVIDSLLHRQGHAHQLGRHLTRDAASRGMQRVDIELPMLPGAVERIRQLNQALDRADDLCRQERLLTLASTPDMLAFRAWVLHQAISQIEHARAPMAYDGWCRLTPPG